MRRGLAVVVIALTMAGLTGTAFAADRVGATGSTFTGGQVQCGPGNTVLPDDPISVYNDGHGLEVCSDHAAIQGRVIVWHGGGGLTEIVQWITVDGDADNPAPLQGEIIDIPVGI